MTAFERLVLQLLVIAVNCYVASLEQHFTPAEYKLLAGALDSVTKQAREELK